VKPAPISDTQPQAAPSAPSDATSHVIGALERRVKELESALSARDEFIATVAHELRNPLSPLFFQMQMMLDQARKRPDAQWAVPRLEKFSANLNHFLGTLDRLLDLSQIAATGVRLQLEELDWSLVLHETCAQFDRQLQLAGSSLHVDASEPVRGRFDRMRLEQICHNLLSNAIRHGAGGPIVARLVNDGGSARLTVTDYGVGISDEDQARIFERFERAASGRTAGFGVGLWVVRQLCAAMEGSIIVRSVLGHGATFEVTIPRRLNPK
jgi:two-component system, OmpR family, sensor kinase